MSSSKLKYLQYIHVEYKNLVVATRSCWGRGHKKD